MKATYNKKNSPGREFRKKFRNNLVNISMSQQFTVDATPDLKL